ncbi:peptidylprolyl isomerase [Novosphingobium sp. PC22D]|uniref:peptidyl-prolyl cis-trans isomerase n=1 Tax=Novosphingobium sp. PC22D TaxID=1962403 RepID=UPI000BEFDEFA|nr:peptidyl-prolyl cis-trans isomerase [Novosphingobium sp. PC22D]PEQ13411.1 peptidylprolyl isomerase [Novosphingobium sp. PC22D]
MLHFLRKILHSKVGAIIGIAFLVMIALAFASGDVANNAGFGGVGGGDQVARVGGEPIDAAMLSQSATAGLERVKQDQPTMSMRAFLSTGALNDILDDIIDRTAIAVFGKEHGIVAGDRLIDSEIASLGAFQGPDGKFSETAYRQAIQQRGISESLLRTDLQQGLVARQILVPASFGATLPRSMAARYAGLLEERREGSVVVLPSLLFAPEDKPTDKQIAAYYKANTDDFIRPERRILRYATFGQDAVKTVPAPTDAEIAARYNANKAQYQAVQKRRITQVIVPTEPAAKAIADEVAGGKSLETAAREKGLSAADLEFFAKPDLAAQFSPAVADAAFAAAQGKLATPAKSALGWHLIRVDEIDDRPARSLDDVRAELSGQIATEKKRAALTDLLARLEDQFDDGANLAEAAKSLGLKVETTEPVTADGAVYRKEGETVPETIKPVLQTAFAMEPQEPQVAETERGKTFAIFDVQEIFPSAPAPLAEIKEDVTRAYTIEKGYAAAKEAAVKMQAALRKGATLEKAIADAGRRLPPVQRVGMSRPDLARMQQQGGQIPPPVQLMFSMAKGSIKVQAAPNDRGWFLVVLDEIKPAEVKKDSPLIATAQRELGQIAGNEYAGALRTAIREDVGSTRNETAIRAVRDQLLGNN